MFSGGASGGGADPAEGSKKWSFGGTSEWPAPEAGAGCRDWFRVRAVLERFRELRASDLAHSPLLLRKGQDVCGCRREYRLLLAAGRALESTLAGRGIRTRSRHICSP